MCEGVDIDAPGGALFVAIGSVGSVGAAVVPFGRGVEGSTVFLPFRATHLFRIEPIHDGTLTCRTFAPCSWSDWRRAESLITIAPRPNAIELFLDVRNYRAPFLCAIYAKDLRANEGWGRLLFAGNEESIPGNGFGDAAIHSFHVIDSTISAVEPRRHRLGRERIRIYQLLPRLFGNVNERRKPNGTMEENGVGKFADITSPPLRSLRELGFTHLWLTGVLRQISATAHPEISQDADDPDLLKGLAGSPYAIKDYFDVCADYAVDPRERAAEFHALLRRIHDAGLRVILDFIPNHVARSYDSRTRPDQNFGASDDRTKFFHPGNNFFYVHGPAKLRLPTWKEGVPLSATCKILGTCDGQFDGERDFVRVTGNNVASAEPKLHDWYETVKLNYGFDFMGNVHAYPCAGAPDLPVPDTWRKMDQVLAHWQQMGVDGFRCDMAHMVPAEFWGWAIARAHQRNAETIFVAEAYDNDPMKVPTADPLLRALNDHKGNVMFDLLNAGFTAVYDDPSYKKLKAIYDGLGWANDLDDAFPHEFIFHNSLRYAENHDEVRLASRDHWGNVGMNVGRPVSAILYALSRGPILLSSGQEVGEPATGAEGFAGDDGRTTIFDYWSMPELAKWVNGHRYDGGRLSEAQKKLRAFYGRLLQLANEPAFRDGAFFALNRANIDNPRFGRIAGESASGHWIYACLRYDALTDQRFLVIVNLHRSELLRDVRVHLPAEALRFLALESLSHIRAVDRLSSETAPPISCTAPAEFAAGDLPSLSALYFELQIDASHR